MTKRWMGMLTATLLVAACGDDEKKGANEQTEASVFGRAYEQSERLEVTGSVAYLQADDFDGDGLHDLVVGLDSAQTAQRRLVLLSSRGGLKSEPVELDCSQRNCDHESLLVDVTGDKHRDIVDVYGLTGDRKGTSQLRVYAGDGKGGFASPVTTDLPLDMAYRGDVEDEDGDGTFAVVVRARLSSECHAALPALVQTATACNYDRDCPLDQVCDYLLDDSYCHVPCEQVEAYQADASGHFTRSWNVPLGIKSSSQLALQDFDGDGKSDLFVSATLHASTSQLAPPQLYTRDGQGFSAGVAQPGVHVAPLYTDADGDGVVDANFGYELQFRDAAGAVAAKVPVEEGSASRLTQFRVQGQTLFMHHTSTGTDTSELRVYRVRARAVQFVGRAVIEDSSIDGATAGDFDGDGNIELLFARERGGVFAVTLTDAL